MKRNSSEKESPAVSVVMPIYNASRFLPQSVGDILNQTFDGFELICVDDGSTDESLAQLNEYKKEDQRIKVYSQENVGGGAARNLGICHAKGDYICFLDADDRFEPRLLELAYNAAKNNGSDIVAFNGDSFDALTNRKKAITWLIHGELEQVESNPVSVLNTTVWNKIFRTGFLKENDIKFDNLRVADTLSFTYIALVMADKIGIIDEILVHYRMNNPESVSESSGRFAADTYEALVSVKRQLDKHGVFKANRREFQIFAGQYLRGRFRSISSSTGFIKLYDAVHKRGRYELGLDFNTADGEIQEIDFLRSITEKTALEYLAENRQNLRVSKMLGEETYVLAPTIMRQIKGKKVVIYGGGNVGVDYFTQMMRNRELNVVKWIDRDYKSIGYPVESIDRLSDIEYDYILIAVLDKRIAESMTNALISRGIQTKKVLWDSPAVI